MKLLLGALAGGALVVGGLLLLARMQDEPSQPAQAGLKGPAGNALAAIAAHADSSALLVVSVGELDEPGPDAVIFRSDELQPVASLAKLVVLRAYADAVVARDLDPNATVALEEIERWYVAGTDGGAHDAAVRATPPEDGAWSLREIVAAMIEHSDNAATDWLMMRLGRPAIDRTARAARQPAPVPIAGQMLAGARGEGDPVAAAWRAVPLPRHAARDIVEWADKSGYVGQATWAEDTVRGTADGIARLLAGALENDTMSEPLSWPLRLHPSNSRRFERFLAKGGALPGVLGQAFVVQPRGDREPWIAIALLSGLDEHTWAALQEGSALDELLVELVESEAARRATRKLLG